VSKLLLTFFLGTVFFFTGCAGSNTGGGTAASVDNCASCHRETVSRFEASAHGNLSCSECHDSLEAHLKLAKNTPTIDVRGDSCAACHTQEHADWAASPHAKIPLDLFPNDPRIMQCMKCHQGSGFAAVLKSGQDFKSAWGPPPSVEPEPVTCIACHSPHKPADIQLLRVAKGELCATCHGSKWQNQVLTATPPEPYTGPETHESFSQNSTGNADPGTNVEYSTFADHPHNSGDRCVTCHMARTPGVPSLGGHTFSMRAKDGGPHNIGACITCHGDVASYDISGKQTEVAEALTSLENSLKERNNGTFPGNQPGTCNQCHKGGTLPFDNDPDQILGNAYETYKQIDRDKSLGVHNPPYTLQILRDALETVESEYKQ
jgi:predicted CXXCH cytochrome family protein